MLYPIINTVIKVVMSILMDFGIVLVEKLLTWGFKNRQIFISLKIMAYSFNLQELTQKFSQGQINS